MDDAEYDCCSDPDNVEVVTSTPVILVWLVDFGEPPKSRRLVTVSCCLACKTAFIWVEEKLPPSRDKYSIYVALDGELKYIAPFKWRFEAVMGQLPELSVLVDRGDQ